MWTRNRNPAPRQRIFFTAGIALALLVNLLCPPWALAEKPAVLRLLAEVNPHAQTGEETIRFLEGTYPPEALGGWFEIRSGNEAGIFVIDENTGALSIKNAGRLDALPNEIPLLIEQGQAVDAKIKQSARWNFFRAAGLSERDICRELGLVAHYAITLKIQPAEAAPVRITLAPAIAASAPKRSPRVAERGFVSGSDNGFAWQDLLALLPLEEEAFAKWLAEAQARSARQQVPEPALAQRAPRTAEPEPKPFIPTDSTAEEDPAPALPSTDAAPLAATLRPYWLISLMMLLTAYLLYLFYRGYKEDLEEDSSSTSEKAEEPAQEPKRHEPRAERLQPRPETESTSSLSKAEEPLTEEAGQPVEPVSSSPQDLDQILESIDDEYGDEEESSEEEEPSFEELDAEEEDFHPNADPSLSAEISDYMNELLARNTDDPAEPAASTAVKMREPAQKARTETDRRGTREVPQPVCNYDVESTRNQLEALRQTSNLTATRAIRQASSRRRRQRAIRCGLFVAALVIVYEVVTLVLG